jgi:hypothetical protein
LPERIDLIMDCEKPIELEQLNTQIFVYSLTPSIKENVDNYGNRAKYQKSKSTIAAWSRGIRLINANDNWGISRHKGSHQRMQ